MLVDLLAKTSKVDQKKLFRLAETANRRYKVYEIPKRSGGTRLIQHPSRELKAIQRWIVRALYRHFSVHEAATAYRQGAGIRQNAERHRMSRFTNRYDFASFFPSFTQGRVQDFLKSESTKLGIDLTDEDLQFVGNIVCRRGQLTIGAPSSPAITNAMMYAFDEALFEYCASENLIFTRYADDVFVSSYSPGQLSGVEDEIRRIKRGIPYLSLRINRIKTVSLSRKYARRIAGVTITPDYKLSIGRERKREIKALVHRWSIGALESGRLSYLRGLVAFARDIEPRFELSLRKKYGDENIDTLLHSATLVDLDYSGLII